jgi:hypothetical protein
MHDVAFVTLLLAHVVTTYVCSRAYDDEDSR